MNIPITVVQMLFNLNIALLQATNVYSLTILYCIFSLAFQLAKLIFINISSCK